MIYTFREVHLLFFTHRTFWGAGTTSAKLEVLKVDFSASGEIREHGLVHIYSVLIHFKKLLKLVNFLFLLFILIPVCWFSTIYVFPEHSPQLFHLQLG